MRTQLKKLLLTAFDGGYQQLNKHLIFKTSAQEAHESVIGTLRFLERFSLTSTVAGGLRRATFTASPTEVGGVRLPRPLILAAGFVKGDGFKSEAEALSVLSQARRNIIPGWRIMPALVGAVEFGSFTRYPRMGNEGAAIWRHIESQSTQNRVGLKNPGAMAAAIFLGKRKDKLPKAFGINIALSPGVDDIYQQQAELIESLELFIAAGVWPTWFTLNLSCPNTEDDPLGRQLEAETRQLCRAFIDHLQAHQLDIPLWVKISPNLAGEQYRALIRILDEAGAKAIIATNTLPQPSPDDVSVTAGMGGGKLFKAALLAIAELSREKRRMNYAIDLIGCGGIIDGLTYREYRRLGVKAAQYWSALVYRGPLAAAMIQSELPQHDYEYEAIHSESPA